MVSALRILLRAKARMANRKMLVKSIAQLFRVSQRN